MRLSDLIDIFAQLRAVLLAIEKVLSGAEHIETRAWIKRLDMARRSTERALIAIRAAFACRTRGGKDYDEINAMAHRPRPRGRKAKVQA